MRLPRPLRSLAVTLLLFTLFPIFALASEGEIELESVKQCVMQNDKQICHNAITPNSYNLFDRFYDYKLMPCLPTNISYESEKQVGANNIVTASLPSDNNSTQIFRLVFNNQQKLDLIETLRMGFGEKWQEKINLSEQIYLMMRQNMQDKLTCDMIISLIKPNKK